MSTEVRGAKDGLAAALSAIPGIRVIDHPAGAVSEFPAAVVLFESRTAALTLGGGYSGRIKVVLLVSSASTREAYDALDAYVGPAGPSSVQAAVDADRTWGGTVDDGRLVSVDNVGARKLWGGVYTAADFHFSFVKSRAGRATAAQPDNAIL